jgi:hypothetical protein
LSRQSLKAIPANKAGIITYFQKNAVFEMGIRRPSTTSLSKSDENNANTACFSIFDLKVYSLVTNF